MLFPLFPVITLLKEFPVPLIAAVPAKVRFSILEPSVNDTLLCTVSTPAPAVAASVIVSVVLSTI